MRIGWRLEGAAGAPIVAALGGISAIFEYYYRGIVFQAVGLTLGTLIVLLTVYASGLVKVTEKENASVNEPASLLAVFVADDGARLTTFDR